jgi:hypothetical protein
MPASSMRWIQAVVVDLADIEDRLIAMRQAVVMAGAWLSYLSEM